MFPLCDRGDGVGDQLARCGRRVAAEAEHDDAPVFPCRIGEEPREVVHRPGEAIQLRLDQRARITGRELRVGFTHSEPFERAPGLCRVFLPLDLSPAALRLCRYRRVLSVDAVLLVGGRHARVADDSHESAPAMIGFMGWEHFAAYAEWCNGGIACPERPLYTRGPGVNEETIGTNEQMGLGSIWRCDRCGRRWMLMAHGALFVQAGQRGVKAQWMALDR